jgi:hypothetical protein
MPRIAVYLKSEDPIKDRASHSSSKALWAVVVAEHAGKDIAQAVGQLTTSETWRQVKDRLRPTTIAGGQKNITLARIPRLKAIQRQFAIDIYYPEKRRESSLHPYEGLRRECVAARERSAQAQRERRSAASAQAVGCEAYDSV